MGSILFYIHYIILVYYTYLFCNFQKTTRRRSPPAWRPSTRMAPLRNSRKIAPSGVARSSLRSSRSSRWPASRRVRRPHRDPHCLCRIIAATDCAEILRSAAIFTVVDGIDLGYSGSSCHLKCHRSGQSVCRWQNHCFARRWRQATRACTTSPANSTSRRP